MINDPKKEKFTPAEFSPIGMYGDRQVFQQRNKEGYNEFAFGTGPWVNEHRIVGMFAFFHPEGKIATLETPKDDVDGYTQRGDREEKTFTQAAFEAYLTENKVNLGGRSDLTNFMSKWQE